jgi:DNA-binding CsgD family transcriptional regulator
MQTLAALARHDNTAGAARYRRISEQTVKNELTSAYRKLGVRSRTAAFRRLGWLRAPVARRSLQT